MANIYRKTSKGAEEIATRAHRLSPRLRTALILIDGTRDENALRGLIAQNAAETLHDLASQGYIEVASVAEEARKPEKVAPAPAHAPEKVSFASFRGDAVRAFNDLTGPAGETLAIKMEKATSREQLAPLLQMAHQIIIGARGQQAANDFKARFASF
ncbi:MAG: hypothetical protein LKCHEGNO_00249 [Burkholderiaceae bacterium]|nr:hypothetical protein [Burkholderiaceae bacterium]